MNTNYKPQPSDHYACAGTRAGNIWIANCGKDTITRYAGGDHNSGGGITLPWGVAVDGNDTVWAFNFGVVPPGPNQHSDLSTGIAHLCGANTNKCLPGMHVGNPFSPSTGYRSNALFRITAGQIDPSGNIWLTDNWKIDGDPFQNPGGNAIVIAIGAAGPLQTPLIGPPVPFQ